MNKKRAIATSVNKDQIFAVGCLLLNICEKANDLNFDFIIYHDGINEKDKEILSSIHPTVFIKYEIPTSYPDILKCPAVDYFTPMVFAKFECFALLGFYDKIIWTDYDILLLDDICELFELFKDGLSMMPSGKPVLNQFHTPLANYNMEAEGIGAGLFLCTNEINNPEKLLKFCYDKANELYLNLKLPEQAIFDIMIQEFGLSIGFIDPKIYSPHPSNYEPNIAKIIHCYGQPKFWNGYFNKEWNNYYLTWLSKGGSKIVQKNLLSRLANKIIKYYQLILNK